jgi:hypothetical protein
MSSVLIKDNEIMVQKNNKQVREPAVAGSFYPSDKKELSLLIDEYLNNADLPEISGNIKALIVPHAGYEYSGQVAAYGFKTLAGKPIKHVVLIGNSHQEYFDGISVWNVGYFKTPLGEIAIDEEFADKLINTNPKIIFKESAHLKEHSLEVQLPFLQRVLSASSSRDWKIVPIILGNQGGVDILIDALRNLIDDNTLLIASSDLSHYPSYKDAQYSDNKVIQAILSNKRKNLQKTISDLGKQGISDLQTCACGQDAIEVIMGLMDDSEGKLLKSANSGDVGGDKDKVVGYASILFISDYSSELNKEEQRILLNLAKQAVETYVRTNKIIEVEETNVNLNKHQGAFVTLKKDGELRGCIGEFEPDEPLCQVVIDMAIAAATQDPRFNPVSKNELDDLEYEISVLSPLRKINSWKEIEIGKHGVEIRHGMHRGVFLPQVATENNWDLDTFMSILCTQKAGLPTDCWKNQETEIYVFTAQVFPIDK